MAKYVDRRLLDLLVALEEHGIVAPGMCLSDALSLLKGLEKMHETGWRFQAPVHPERKAA